MKKRITALTLSPLLFALCFSVEAQQPKKVPLIGYLSSSDAATESTRAEAIRLALQELGYIEEQNIAIEYRYGEGRGNANRVSQLASELVRLKVDIIVVAGGGPVIRAAMNATKTIPIVMAGLGIDPVGAWFRALPVPVATSLALQSFPGNWAVSGWSCSKKRFPELPASRFSTMRLVRALSPT